MGARSTKIIIVVMLISGILVFSQNYRIQYNINYRPKVEVNDRTSENYLLDVDVSNKLSFFKFKNHENSDFNGNVYKDFSKNIFNKYEVILYKFYRTDYQFTENWKLRSQKKEILEMECNSASVFFGGREWIAWYTSEIPVQDGPYKFSGLPGLILEVSSVDDDYRFLATSIEKLDVSIVPISAISLGNIQKEKEFKENTVADPAAQYKLDLLQHNLKVTASFNGKVSTSKEIIDAINTNFWDFMKSHNNPIEKGSIWIK